MRKLVVILLLTSGLVAAGQAFRSEVQNREDHLAAMTRILTSPSAATLPAQRDIPAADMIGEPPRAVAAPDLLAPPTRIIATDLATGRAVETFPPRPAAAAPLPPAAPAAEPGLDTALSPWTTTVSVEPPAATAAPPKDRYRLVRTIQRELKRVRCYNGPIDGSWGDRSRNAMQRFIERANASLPTVEPDGVLLTLLQAHATVTCGTCPSGQTLVDGSRCVPNAILARTDKPRQPAEAAVAANGAPAGGSVVTGALPAPQRDPMPGRMAVGGPVATLPGVDRQGAERQPSPAVVAALEPRDGADIVAGALPVDQAGAAVGPSIPAAKPGGAPPRPPRVSTPRPARAVARAAPRERGVHRNPPGVRSVQSLFTHPLGRL
jgi:hypothetical protein